MMVCNGERRVQVEVEGAGEITVIALHGGPGFTHDTLRPGLSRLAARGFRVVFVDLPGGGGSSRHVGAGYALEPYIEDIGAIRREVGGERVAVLGHAWGAILACEYALGQPVDALILVNPLRILRGEGQDAEAQARRVAAVDPTLFPDYIEGVYPLIQAAQAGGRGWEAVDASPWWARMMDTQLADAPSPEWRGAMAATRWGLGTYFDFKGAAFSDPEHPLNHYDLAARAAALVVPTLVFASDNDANYVAPARIHAAPVVEALPDATVFRMDDCGHFPFAEAPEAFAIAAAAFLHQLAVPDRAPSEPVE
jgi:pimeloyl-ACP methyl ester carboxylesterase